ncbi:MAG TPA: CotH kinase family protein [Fibrobacteraceae bacterium]|nr:CotH kinase family protein [Fibrobacteraceae bacterium]
MSKKFLACFFGIAIVAVPVLAAESSDTLFATSPVRNYNLTFYSTTWQSELKANYEADSGYVLAKFSDGTTTLDSVGIRYKGNSSYADSPFPKKPLKIKFNEFVSGQKYYGVKVLNFSNGYGDPTFLREKIAYDIARQYMPAPRANYANISFNDTLIGLYTQVEQEDKIFIGNWFENDSMNLFKAGDGGGSLQYGGSDPTYYSDSIGYELKTNEDANDWSGFIKFVYAMDSIADTNFCDVSSTYLDETNVTKFLAFNMVMSHFDSYTGSARNYYMYQLSDDGLMYFLPWDMNLTFGGYSNGWDVYEQDPVSINNLSRRPLNRKVLACDSLRYRYLAWIREMVNGYAATDSVQKAIDTLSALIRSSVEADTNKFYSIGAFDSNQTAIYVASSTEIIPGLIEFSQYRDSVLLSKVASALPDEYILPVVATQKNSSLAIGREGRHWILSGMENLGHCRVEWFQVSGRRSGIQRYDGSRGALVLDLPTGLILLRVTSAGQSQVFTLQNR